MGIVHVGSFAASSQSVKSTKVPGTLFRTVGGPISEYGARLASKRFTAVMCDEWGTPGKARPGCTPKEVELKLKAKDVVPKEMFATAQNQGWLE